ncbi:unnamed protein product, partial [marine sediment metagenome]
KKLLTDMKALEEKNQKVIALVKTKLDKDMKDMSGPGKGGGPLDDVAKTSLDDLTFKGQNGTVTFTDKKGNTETFVKENGAWKGKLDADKKEMLGVVVEMLAATDKMLDAITAGVNDGSITKDNFDQKAEQLSKTHMGPAMAKLMAVAMKTIAKKTGAPASQPATAPATAPVTLPATAPATRVAKVPTTPPVTPPVTPPTTAPATGVAKVPTTPPVTPPVTPPTTAPATGVAKVPTTPPVTPPVTPPTTAPATGVATAP